MTIKKSKNDGIGLPHRLNAENLNKLKNALVREMKEFNPNQERITEIKKKYIALAFDVYENYDAKHFKSL